MVYIRHIYDDPQHALQDVRLVFQRKERLDKGEPMTKREQESLARAVVTTHEMKQQGCS